MSNTYFQFKQFIIHQDKAALKVCTDACCLGAIVAPKTKNAQNILDLGTGTGLLCLMLAQMNQAKIIGIDIHESSVIQASENFAFSNWSDRLEALVSDVTQFESNQSYDWIICNPPFFENALKSPQAEKDLSKHIERDGWKIWVDAIQKNLSPQGKAAMLIPYFATEKVKAAFEEAALYSEEEIYIHHSAHKPAFRTVLIVSFDPPTTLLKDTFIIRESDQSYTAQFKNYLAPYYLYL